MYYALAINETANVLIKEVIATMGGYFVFGLILLVFFVMLGAVTRGFELSLLAGGSVLALMLAMGWIPFTWVYLLIIPFGFLVTAFILHLIRR